MAALREPGLGHGEGATTTSGFDRRRELGLGLAALALAAAMTGCTDQSTEPTPSETPPSTSTSPEPEPTPSDPAPSDPTTAPADPAPDDPAQPEPTAPSSAPDPTDAEGMASREALDRYIDRSRAEVEAELEQYQDVYSGFTLRAEGAGTLVYEYTFREQLDAAQASAGISEGRPDLEQIATAEIFPGMRSAGVPEPAVRWIYLNADGTQIVSIDVES